MIHLIIFNYDILLIKLKYHINILFLYLIQHTKIKYECKHWTNT
jgi:hypothetical protein